MDKSYFESLQNSIQEPVQVADEVSANNETAYLIIRVDIDCFLSCNEIELGALEANKVGKYSIPTGLHILSVVSQKCKEVFAFVNIDAYASGRNYRQNISLKEKEQFTLQKLGIIKSKEEEYESIIKEKDAIISSLRDKSEEQVSKLEEKDSKISEVQAEKEYEIQKMREFYESKLNNQNSTISDLTSEKEREIQSLRENYESKLQDKDSLISDLKVEINYTKKKLDELYEAKSNEIKAKQRIDDLTSLLEEYKSADIDKQNELDKLSARHKIDVTEISKLTTEINRVKADMGDYYDIKSEELKSKIAYDTQKENEKLKNDIESLKNRHEEEIQELKKLSEKEKQESLSNLKQEMQISLNNQLAIRDEAHLHQIDEYKEEFETFKQRMKEEIDKRNASINHLNALLEDNILIRFAKILVGK